MDLVTSSQHPKVKYIHRLFRRRFRDREGVFIIEGVRFLEEALDAGWPLELVLFSPRLETSGRGRLLLSRLADSALPLLPVTDGLMAGLAGTETPQGVLAVARRREGQPLAPGRPNLVLLVDGLQDPGNLGTIIRTADAAAVGQVILLKGTVDLYNPKTLRATMGSLFHLPVVQAPGREEILAGLEAAGYQLAVGDPSGDVYPREVDFSGPIALAVGSEAGGVGPDLRQRARWRVRIPMPGRAESLNAAVAAGILLYEAVRRSHVSIR